MENTSLEEAIEYGDPSYDVAQDTLNQLCSEGCWYIYIISEETWYLHNEDDIIIQESSTIEGLLPNGTYRPWQEGNQRAKK